MNIERHTAPRRLAVGRRARAQRRERRLARVDVDGPPVVGVDEGAVQKLVALVDLGHARARRAQHGLPDDDARRDLVDPFEERYEARTNWPGRANGNWKWRLERGALTAELARRLRAETEATERLAAR